MTIGQECSILERLENVAREHGRALLASTEECSARECAACPHFDATAFSHGLPEKSCRAVNDRLRSERDLMAVCLDLARAEERP